MAYSHENAGRKSRRVVIPPPGAASQLPYGSRDTGLRLGSARHLKSHRSPGLVDRAAAGSGGFITWHALQEDFERVSCERLLQSGRTRMGKYFDGAGTAKCLKTSLSGSPFLDRMDTDADSSATLRYGTFCGEACSKSRDPNDMRGP
jgi:hypothetical protein